MDAETERILVEVTGDTEAISLELDGEDIKDVMAADAWSPFSLDYVESSSGASPKGTPVRLTFGSDFPLVVADKLDL